MALQRLELAPVFQANQVVVGYRLLGGDRRLSNLGNNDRGSGRNAHNRGMHVSEQRRKIARRDRIVRDISRNDFSGELYIVQCIGYVKLCSNPEIARTL